MKIIDFTKRRRKGMAGEPRQVPVLTFAKGKFTLALESLGERRSLVVYNTATKIEIARRKAGAGGREAWVAWAEAVVNQWQRAHGHVEE